MKIAIIVPYFAAYIRSNEYGLANGLSKLGHDVTVFASDDRAVRERAVTDEDNPDNYSFRVERLRTLSRAFENPITSGVRGAMRGFDVAMLQEDYPFICIDAYHGCKKYGVKTVLSTERYYSPPGIKGHALRLLDLTLSRELRYGSDALTTHTHASRVFIRRLGSRPVEVVPVGIETRLFVPKARPHDGFNIYTVARLHPYKGLEYLMSAMPYVRSEVPDAMLTILGRGPDEARLREFAAAQSKKGICFETTPIPNEEMPDWLAGCDVYAQPSLIEPFGIAALEAMSCGKPVVASPVGGLADTVVSGETGYLVPSRDIKAFAGAIIKMAQNRRATEQMGQRARSRAEGYDWRRVCLRYLEMMI